MNSGDFVENLTALVEDAEGNWSIYKYLEEQDKKAKAKALKKLLKEYATD